jgi:hypothetical protein
LDSVFFYKTPDNKNVSENGNIKIKNINPLIYNNIKGILGADAAKALNENVYLYGLHLSNVGGLISPVIVQANYKDGTSEIIRLPAEIWRYNPENITKVLHLPKEVTSFCLDPNLETADIDEENNYFPRKKLSSQFDKIKNGASASIEEEED